MVRGCNACGKAYEDSGFGAMNGIGETAVSEIEIYDVRYHLCPECTLKVYRTLQKITKESKY